MCHNTWLYRELWQKQAMQNDNNRKAALPSMAAKKSLAAA